MVLKVHSIGNEYIENNRKEDNIMSGINIKYCVDGFNNYAFDNVVDAAKYAKVADRCYFYNTTNTELYDCKNTWVNNDDDDPIVTAVSDSTLIYIPDIETFNIIRENCAAPDLFPFDINTFVGGWYFYNYLIATEDFNDDCFLPLKGNEELFTKQYNPEMLNDINRLTKD